MQNFLSKANQFYDISPPLPPFNLYNLAHLDFSIVKPNNEEIEG